MLCFRSKTPVASGGKARNNAIEPRKYHPGKLSARSAPRAIRHVDIRATRIRRLSPAFAHVM